MDNKTHDQSFVDFLIESAKQGSVVAKLDEIKAQLSALDEKSEQVKIQEMNLNERLNELDSTLHLINAKEASLKKESAAIQALDFELQKLKLELKLKAENLEMKEKAIDHKIGEAEAKQKRLAIDEERLKGFELSLLMQRKKLEEAQKQIEQIINLL